MKAVTQETMNKLFVKDFYPNEEKIKEAIGEKIEEPVR